MNHPPSDPAPSPLSTRLLDGLTLAVILAAGILLRVPYWTFWDLFYNADYSIVSLMALHFLKGEFAPYHWGASYHGNLEPALVAPLFAWLGPHPQVALLVPFAFSILFIALYFFYVRHTCGRAVAGPAALLIAGASPVFLAVTMRNANYVEIFCLGLAQLMLYDGFRRGRRDAWRAFAFGLAAGFAWYYLKVTLVFWMAMALDAGLRALDLERVDRARSWLRAWSLHGILRRVVLLRGADLPGWARGALAAVNIYNLANLCAAAGLWLHGPFARRIGSVELRADFWPVFESSLKLAAAVALIVYRKPIWRALRGAAAQTFWRALAAGFALGYLPAIAGFMLGVSPDSRTGVANRLELTRNLRLVASELIPQMSGRPAEPWLFSFAVAVVAAGCAALVAQLFRIARAKWLRQEPVPAETPLLFLAAATFALGVSYDRLVNLGALRYFLPLQLAVPLGIAWLFRRMARAQIAAAWIGVLLFLGAGLSAHLQAWRMHESPNPYAQLAAHLRMHDLSRGFSDYWTAYPVNQLTAEKIILAADDDSTRYPPYLAEALAAERAAWITPSPVPIGARLEMHGAAYDVVGESSVERFTVYQLQKVGAEP